MAGIDYKHTAYQRSLGDIATYSYNASYWLLQLFDLEEDKTLQGFLRIDSLFAPQYPPFELSPIIPL